MATLSRSRVSLRIIGDELVPDEVSALLGCDPTTKKVKGQPFAWTKQSKPRIAKSGMWRLKATDRSPGNLDEQIAELLALVTRNIDVWTSLREKYSIDLFCGLFMESAMEGISISSESLLALGRRGIEIDFDMYGPDDESV
ncbi:DUF4279 domain-containing protein [Gynuella sp.]|uniref:DUF4279 domain-containing protein n=1 Tax=Gynuella sp. TaxID=2969146 RepID=UPI003D09C3F5